MKWKLIIFLTLGVVYSCQTQDKIVKKTYPRWIGDINPEEKDGDFQVCFGDNNIKQYFNNSHGLEYFGEKKEIEKEFKTNFTPSTKKNQNGIIRIRFVVNCKGETGRFRVLEADDKYQEFHFDKKITNQLLRITKGLKGWYMKEHRNKKLDYYQYLIFVIKDGNIKEILP